MGMSNFADYNNQDEFDTPKTMQALVASGSGFENLAVQMVDYWGQSKEVEFLERHLK